MDLVDDRRFVVGFLGAERAFQQIDDREKRNALAEGYAATVQPPGCVIADALLEFVNDAGLADACLANDEHHLAMATACACEGGLQRGKLRVTTNERRQAALGWRNERGPGKDANHLMRGD